MTTIQRVGGATITPLLVIGYESTRTARNVVHQILNRANPDVSLRPATLRTGTLTMLCASLAIAQSLEQLHLQDGIMRLQDADLPAAAMYYVPNGSITVTLDPEGRRRALVAVDFHEVTV